MSRETQPLRNKTSVLPGLRGPNTPAGWKRVSDGFADLYWRKFSSDSSPPKTEDIYASMWRVLDHVSRVAQWVNNEQIVMLEASILKQPEELRHLLWNRSFNLIDGFVGSGIEDPQSKQVYDHVASGKEGPAVLLDDSQWRKAMMIEGLSECDPPGTVGAERRATTKGREILNRDGCKYTKETLKIAIISSTGEELGTMAWKRVWQNLTSSHPELSRGGRPRKNKT